MQLPPIILRPLRYLRVRSFAEDQLGRLLVHLRIHVTRRTLIHTVARQIEDLRRAARFPARAPFAVGVDVFLYLVRVKPTMDAIKGVDAEIDLLVYFHELQNAGLFHQGCV